MEYNGRCIIFIYFSVSCYRFEEFQIQASFSIRTCDHERLASWIFRDNTTWRTNEKGQTHQWQGVPMITSYKLLDEVPSSGSKKMALATWTKCVLVEEWLRGFGRKIGVNSQIPLQLSSFRTFKVVIPWGHGVLVSSRIHSKPDSGMAMQGKPSCRSKNLSVGCPFFWKAVIEMSSSRVETTKIFQGMAMGQNLKFLGSIQSIHCSHCKVHRPGLERLNCHIARRVGTHKKSTRHVLQRSWSHWNLPLPTYQNQGKCMKTLQEPQHVLNPTLHNIHNIRIIYIYIHL